MGQNAGRLGSGEHFFSLLRFHCNFFNMMFKSTILVSLLVVSAMAERPHRGPKVGGPQTHKHSTGKYVPRPIADDQQVKYQPQPIQYVQQPQYQQQQPIQYQQQQPIQYQQQQPIQYQP